MATQAIFITGAASGIGRATALRFAREGWFVAGTDVSVAGLDALRDGIGNGRCWTRRLDVTDKADYDRAIAELGEVTGGGLDLLFNNAGIGFTGYFDEIPYEHSIATVQVNLIGVLNGIYAALPLLIRTPNSLCFSTASSAATFGAPSLAVYAATKFAVKGLTEALSVELARYGVRAADVLPGLIDTPILHSPKYVGGERVAQTTTRTIGANPPPDGMWRLLQPDAVAAAVWDAYHGDRVHWYVPPEIEDIEHEKVRGVEALRDARIEMTKSNR